MKFRATLELGGKTATGFRVAAEVVAALGTSKRPPMRVTINGHAYRSTVAVYGGVFMVGVSWATVVAEIHDRISYPVYHFSPCRAKNDMQER